MTQDKEIETACESIIRYLENFNPHASIVITSDGIYQVSTDIFIPVKK